MSQTLYNGDRVRVARVRNGDVTYLFMGGLYEVNVSVPAETVSGSKSYYAIEGQLLAMSDGSETSYLLTDHLGSVVGVVGETGSLLEERRYLPCGEARVLSGTVQTDLSFTGQRALTGTGLLDRKVRDARQYDPSLRTFIQPDSIIPNPYGVQDYNRYLYVHANPVRFTDPSGNRLSGDGELVDCEGNTTDKLSLNIINGELIAKNALENWDNAESDKCTYPCTEFASKSYMAVGAVEDDFWFEPLDCNADHYAWSFTDKYLYYLTKYRFGPKLSIITIEKEKLVNEFPSEMTLPAGSMVFYDDGMTHEGFTYLHVAIVTGRNIEFTGKSTPEVIDRGGAFTGPHSIMQMTIPYRLVVVIMP